MEIGRSSYEHGVVFQKRFPRIIRKTNDQKLAHRKSIISWIHYEDLTKKMPKPLEIDVEKIPWKNSIKISFFITRNSLYKYDSCIIVVMYASTIKRVRKIT